jgi:hypothetical protein
MGLLVLSPAAVSILFTLPRPAMLRYIDNVVVACLVSPIAFTAAVETYDASCGAESIPGVAGYGPDAGRCRGNPGRDCNPPVAADAPKEAHI